MTTTAPRQDGAATQEIDERTQSAWADYQDALRDLTGRDYDDAEHEAWEKLQETLSAIGDRTAGPVGGSGLSPTPS